MKQWIYVLVFFIFLASCEYNDTWYVEFSVNPYGPGSGSISPDSTPQGFYADGTPVTAEAIADEDSYFAYWCDQYGANYSFDNPLETPYIRPALMLQAVFYLKDDSCTFHYCPGGTFPSGVDDNNEKTVTSFEIAETEVPIKLWLTVYPWAVKNNYTFAHSGNFITENHQMPLVNISCWDAIIWTNAFTEYYNEKHGTAYTPVYLIDDSPARSSQEQTTFLYSNLVRDESASGFIPKRKWFSPVIVRLDGVE